MTNRTMFRALAWSLALTLLSTGCGSSGSTDEKCATALRINLEVGDGTTIDQVEYEITGNDMEPMSGVIDTSAPGSTASFEQFGIPPGEGYVVTMVATSTDGSVTCGGASEFDVGSGGTTEVDVILNCKASPEFGGVRVNGKLNVCAELEKVIVAPLQTSTGFALEVSAIGSDAEDDDIEYSWSSTAGTFADPTSPDTIYTCNTVAAEEITVEVSDDGFEYCDASWTVPINCVDGSGGTGGSGGGAGGSGGTAGSGGTGGSGGSGGGTGGTGGSGGSGGGTGGSGGTGGTGGTGGGTGGSAGGPVVPPECLVTLSVR